MENTQEMQNVPMSIPQEQPQIAEDMPLLEKSIIANKVITRVHHLYEHANSLKSLAAFEKEEAKKAKGTRIIVPIILFVVFNIFGLLISLIMFLPRFSPKPHLKKADKYEKEAQDVTNEADTFIQNNVQHLVILPKKYWFPMATNYIVELFQTNRADSLPVAFDKLEEQLHRWRMEEALQSNLRAQLANAQILSRIEANSAIAVTNSAISAGASVANLFS